MAADSRVEAAVEFITREGLDDETLDVITGLLNYSSERLMVNIGIQSENEALRKRLRELEN